MSHSSAECWCLDCTSTTWITCNVCGEVQCEHDAQDEINYLRLRVRDLESDLARLRGVLIKLADVS